MQLCDIVREMVSGDLAIVTHVGCYLSFSAKSLARRLTAWPVKYRIVTLGTGRCLLFQGKLFLKLWGLASTQRCVAEIILWDVT